MASITERQGDILKNIIGEYIKFAKPVSSHLLEEKYCFNICPATIRIEMQKLTDNDYLYQPHTSAGRVPTNKGYRFFVDNFLTEITIKDSSDIQCAKKTIKKEKENIFNFIAKTTEILAELSSSFVMAGSFKRSFFSKYGWGQIFKEPEFENRDFLLDFVEFLGCFEKDIEEINIDFEPRIYIGEESSIDKSAGFSIIFSKCTFPEQDDGFISILGPTRMSYSKNIGLIHSLTKLLEEIGHD